MKKYIITLLLLPLLFSHTVSAETVPSSNLTFGMRGSEVKSLQILLEKFGYLEKDNHTGYFGQKTLKAVKYFQKSNGIKQTGLFGKLSRQKMEEINKDSISGISVGGDKDSHGCVLGGGYSWSEAQKACVRPWEKVTNTLTSGTWNLFELDKKVHLDLHFQLKTEESTFEDVIL